MKNGSPESDQFEDKPFEFQGWGDPQLESEAGLDSRFEQLSAYLDGELSVTEARRVEDWLAHDPEAQALYSQLRTMQAGFDHVPLPPVTSDELELLVDTVLDQVSQPRWLRWCQHSQPLIHKVAAGLIVMLGSGLATWHWSHPQPIVSIEDPPVQVADLSPSVRVAGHYLLELTESEDPFMILFSDEISE